MFGHYDDLGRREGRDKDDTTVCLNGEVVRRFCVSGNGFPLRGYQYISAQLEAEQGGLTEFHGTSFMLKNLS